MPARLPLWTLCPQHLLCDRGGHTTRMVLVALLGIPSEHVGPGCRDRKRAAFSTAARAYLWRRIAPQQHIPLSPPRVYVAHILPVEAQRFRDGASSAWPKLPRSLSLTPAWLFFRTITHNSETSDPVSLPGSISRDSTRRAEQGRLGYEPADRE